MKKEHRSAERKTEGQMPREVLIATYFRENTPPEYRNQSVMNTSISQLQRAGIASMGELDVMTEEKIERIRNIGLKRRELVLLMRDKYRTEHKAINY